MWDNQFRQCPQNASGFSCCCCFCLFVVVGVFFFLGGGGCCFFALFGGWIFFGEGERAELGVKAARDLLAGLVVRRPHEKRQT